MDWGKLLRHMGKMIGWAALMYTSWETKVIFETQKNREKWEVIPEQFCQDSASKLQGPMEDYIMGYAVILEASDALFGSRAMHIAEEDTHDEAYIKAINFLTKDGLEKWENITVNPLKDPKSLHSKWATRSGETLVIRSI